MFKDTNSRLHINVLKHLQVKIFTVITTNVNLTMVFLFKKKLWELLYIFLESGLFYWTWVCSDQSASIKRYPVVSPFDYITSTTEYNTKQYNRLFMLRNLGSTS